MHVYKGYKLFIYYEPRNKHVLNITTAYKKIIICVLNCKCCCYTECFPAMQLYIKIKEKLILAAPELLFLLFKPQNERDHQ